MKLSLIVVLVALVAASPAAAAPDNDDVADARALGALPARVTGTTSDASAEADEPASTCGRTSGTVWYRLRADRRGPIVAQARGGRGSSRPWSASSGGRGRGSSPSPAAARTQTAGRWSRSTAARDREYVILVATVRGSDGDVFRLEVSRPEPKSIPPGRPLEGVSGLDRAPPPRSRRRVGVRHGARPQLPDQSAAVARLCQCVSLPPAHVPLHRGRGSRRGARMRRLHGLHARAPTAAAATASSSSQTRTSARRSGTSCSSRPPSRTTWRPESTWARRRT